jgi:Cu2+-exporting ATPase
MLTGESTPVEKKPGSAVIGGSVNGEGSLTIKVSRTGAESFLSQVIDLVRQAQESKSKTQDIANRAAMWLTIVAIGGGALTMFAWLVVAGREFVFALERTVTVMVIACPHALGLAVPLVVAVSTALSARHGLLIRNRAAFERGRNIQAVIFDKTGTLTEGRFGLTDTISFSDTMTADRIVALAASIEARSEHPIARGIAAAAKESLPAEDFKAIPGKGAHGRVSGRHVAVVSPGYLRESDMQIPGENIAKLQAEGKTVVFVLIDGELKGAIALADIIRPESRTAVSMLKQMGIRCMMLTGDNRHVAQWVSAQVGLDEYFADVLPQDKAKKVREVQSRGIIVAMTGDGVNDAPALARADVGIAIGAGTDVAVEAADIVLVRSNPMDVVAIVRLARATYRKMVQNLAWATGYNALAIPLAAGVLSGFGILPGPALGAVLMSISTIIVAVNAQLIRMTDTDEPKEKARLSTPAPQRQGVPV